jgi:hypothetical protein
MSTVARVITEKVAEKVERIRGLVERGRSYEQAVEEVRRTSCFGRKAWSRVLDGVANLNQKRPY